LENTKLHEELGEIVAKKKVTAEEVAKYAKIYRESQDWFFRHEALGRLRHSEHPEAREIFLQATNDSQPLVRCRAVVYLGEIKVSVGCREAIEALLRVLTGAGYIPTWNLRKEAVIALSRIVPDYDLDVHNAILECLNSDTSKRVQEAAASALGRLRYTKAIDDLYFTILRETTPVELASTCALSIKQIGIGAAFIALKLCNILNDVSGSSAIVSDATAINAIEALTVIGSPEVLPVLQRLASLTLREPIATAAKRAIKKIEENTWKLSTPKL
jgi:HEAT repeat protein